MFWDSLKETMMGRGTRAKSEVRSVFDVYQTQQGGENRVNSTQKKASLRSHGGYQLRLAGGGLSRALS